MPTGYTSDIYDGKLVTGSEFILKCARNFGALITMRDEPRDAEIPIFKVSNWYLERVEEAKKNLEKYKKMPVEEAEKMANESYRKAVESNSRIIKEKNEKRSRYMKVLSEVKQWSPPTEEHIKLKEFAIGQLEMSINADCDISYYERSAIKQTGEELLKEMINYYESEIEYCERNYEQEVKVITERNKWVSDLKESFKK